MAEIMDKHHDTFAREIVVRLDPTRTVVDINTNPLFPTPRKTNETVFTPVNYTIMARILYGRPRDATLSERTKYNDVAIDIHEGWVRIKVKDESYDILKDAKRITFDDKDFIVDSHSRGHGMFDVDFFTFYLKPVNSD